MFQKVYKTRSTYGHSLTHTHTHTYIYICIFRQHFFVHANFIKHNRHFMSTYSLLDPFEFPYYFYRIRGELIYVLSIVVCIPSTFCPTLGHHQGRIYYKSDVTSVLAYYYCVRASLPLKIMFNEICIYRYIYIYIYTLLNNSLIYMYIPFAYI